MTESGTIGLSNRDILPVLVKGLAGHDLVSTGRYVLKEVHSADLRGGRNGSPEVRILPVDRSVQAVQPNS